MESFQQYRSELTTALGDGWTRFWFQPGDPLPACVLRIFTGLAALGYLLSFSGDLTRWFSKQGIMSTGLVEAMLDESLGVRFSYLDWLTSPTELWIAHLTGIAVVCLFTIGLFSRVTNILSLLVVLSYVHRGPALVGLLEPVLTMLLFYLCFAPTGAYLSLDSRRKRDSEPPAASWTSNLALRLIQVHLTAFYLLFALSKMSGIPWVEGDATWILMAQTRSRLLDWTFMRNAVYLVNAWTHAIVIFEFSFAILIWNRLTRPLMLAIAVIMWLLTGFLTGFFPFALVMLVANLAFVSAEFYRAILGIRPGEKDLEAA